MRAITASWDSCGALAWRKKSSPRAAGRIRQRGASLRAVEAGVTMRKSIRSPHVRSDLASGLLGQGDVVTIGPFAAPGGCGLLARGAKRNLLVSWSARAASAPRTSSAPGSCGSVSRQVDPVAESSETGVRPEKHRIDE